MNVFIDTSALFPLIEATDADHHRAKSTWIELTRRQDILVTSNYVLLEASALIQRRHGLRAAFDLFENFAPALDVHWIGAEIHAAAVAKWTSANRTKLSLVDCSSFELMRVKQISHAFAFDRHFNEEGFKVLP